jgi:hypothetical protein
MFLGSVLSTIKSAIYERKNDEKLFSETAFFQKKMVGQYLVF